MQLSNLAHSQQCNHNKEIQSTTKLGPGLQLCLQRNESFSFNHAHATDSKQVGTIQLEILNL